MSLSISPNQICRWQLPDNHLIWLRAPSLLHMFSYIISVQDLEAMIQYSIRTLINLLSGLGVFMRRKGVNIDEIKIFLLNLCQVRSRSVVHGNTI